MPSSGGSAGGSVGGSAEAPIDPFSADGPGSWFLLRTRTRQEKVVASDFAARGVMHYLPLMQRVRTHGRRKVEVEMPVFPGYVFLRGTPDDAYTADRAGRLAQIIPIKDQKRFNEELRNIWFALTRKARLSYYPYLKRGVKVEVRAGPFRGLCGVIENWSKRHRLILQVEILGRSVSLEVDGALLDVID